MKICGAKNKHSGKRHKRRIRNLNNKKTHYSVSNYYRPITSHHFSHAHDTFWLGIEQCSNRRRNLVPDDTRTRTRRQKMESISFMVTVSGTCVMSIN